MTLGGGSNVDEYQAKRIIVALAGGVAEKICSKSTLSSMGKVKRRLEMAKGQVSMSGTRTS